jgi:hypothetical protein
MARARPAAPPPRPPRAGWTRRFARNVLLWLVPAAVVWLVLTPWYNQALIRGAESLLHLFESPNQSRLYLKADHYLTIVRGDYRGGQAVAGEFRVSDSHFNWIMLAALFLAVPDLPWRARLRNLGRAAAIMAVFHLALVLFHIEFFPATQLGEWSVRHYGPFARNLFGLGKHLLDLPFKFGLPLALWAAFHWPALSPARRLPQPRSAAPRDRQ